MNDDLISRQAAISVTWNAHNTGDACRELRMLPSVQPERKKGEWTKVNVAIMVQKTGRWIANDEYDGEVYYICSRCEAPWVTIDGTPQENGMKYCPHCGAKMEGEKE